MSVQKAKPIYPKRSFALNLSKAKEIDQKLINTEMTEINPTPHNILLDEVEEEEEEDGRRS